MQKFLIILLLVSISLFAQTKEEKGTFGIKFNGYVKTDFMSDSRQTVTAREGHFLLYPSNEVDDADGDDINAVANFNMLAIQTRLSGKITAPDVLGAKTSGLIEGAFFGHSNSDVNGFRLRHAFLKLAWGKSYLLIGQYWHPMFITECFPGTISFNTGAPFQPFSRNPQIRYMHAFNNLYLTGTLVTQRDFASTGPNGVSSSYLRNSGMPMMDVNLKYMISKLVIGGGMNYKSILPRLSETNFFGTYKSDAKVHSFATMLFTKVVISKFTVKAEGVYGQNLYDLVMLGGYGVSELDNNGFVSEYTNLKTFSTWAELVFGKALQFGLFTGFTKNLGASDDIVGATYGRGLDISSVVRIAPRAQYTYGKTRFAAEIEYTGANYGDRITQKSEVRDTNHVANFRLLLAAYLFF
jgi:hypothetical protein